MLSTTVGAIAQKGRLQRANRLFKTLNYQEAIEAYLAILDKRDAPEAKINLAECYRKVDNWADAEYWYGQVVRLPEAMPVHKLYYGMALQANGKCDQAKQWFEEYTSLVPDDLRGKLLREACEQKVVDRLMKAGALFKVVNVTPLNTSYDDFGVSYFDNGIVFSSERDAGVAFKRVHTWTGHPFLELFFTKRTLVDEELMEYKYSEPDKYSAKINSKFHDGPVSFTKDFKEIYFTRNNVVRGKVGRDDEGIVRLKIFYAAREGDSWGEMQSLPFNSDEYSVAHPALSADGSMLFFVSDMPGGFGGMDLYVSYLENGRWSPPVNLGPSLNTEGNELFPYMQEDGTLYFSSDGHTGLGGLDIYYARQTAGTWTVPLNVGYPVNTISDDFGFAMNAEKTHGYFSSNREGGSGGDDIYSYTRFSVNVEVLVFDKNSGDPIEGATVSTGYDPVPNIKTGPDGRAFIQLPVEQTFEFVGSKEMYEDGAATVSTRKVKPGEPLFIQIPLQQPYQVSVVGVVRDPSGKPIKGARVLLESNCGQPVQEMLTGDDGYYDFELLANCCYKLTVVRDGYETETETFCNEVADPNNPTRNMPVVMTPKDLPAPPIVGKAYDLKHIYYNFDRYEIRTDASVGLDTLLKILRDNADVIVEIGSHTDARGTNKYNERLSARRAESVVNWLVKKGIDRKRVRSKGYGETSPTNKCFDNVPCSETEHQLNRRTEFKVVGTIGGVAKELKSVVPDQKSIKIDPCKKCPF